MLTQAQAQAHANLCGMNGIALPIPVSPSDLSVRYRLADDITHPEHQEHIARASDIVTGFTLLCWAECFGLDYVTIV